MDFQFTAENFEGLALRYWRKLYVIALRRVNDEEVAKDLVQEVFTHCWQQRETIRIHTSVESYFRMSLHRLIIAHFRRLDVTSKAFAYVEQRLLEEEEHMPDLLSQKDIQKTLNQEVEIMPFTMRQIFRLRMKDYTVEEIAHSLNIAPKTVRNNISQGLHFLKKAIAKDFPKDFPTISILLYVFLT